MYYYGPMMNGYDWGWSIIMMVLWVVFLVIVAVVVVRIIKTPIEEQPSCPSPLAIAKERYAKGEITKAVFEQLKKDLK